MLRYASLFLLKRPEDTIKELKRDEYRSIDVKKLMPAFMNIAI